MTNFRFLLAPLLVAIPLALVTGCGGGGGGGGGGGSSATATPTPAATATAGGRILVVQLRDSAGRAVDGIVTIGTTVMATVNGNATFNSNIAAGATVVSAEVDGIVKTGTAKVNASGSTIYTLTITPSVTPVPSATIPTAPF